MQVSILEQTKNTTKGEKMIKELVIGLGYIIIITIVLYPVSGYLADIMLLLMPVSILNTVIISIVRFFGFFVGVGTAVWIYKGLNLQEQQQFNGGF